MNSDGVPDASSGCRFEAGELEHLARSFERKHPKDILHWAFERFGKKRFALVSSFQAEAMVLLDIAAQLEPDVRVVTIDTGRLPAETYEFIDRVREHYNIRIEVVYPEADLVEAMTTKYGVNLFYRKTDLRKLCCHVRKVRPLAVFCSPSTCGEPACVETKRPTDRPFRKSARIPTTPTSSSCARWPTGAGTTFGITSEPTTFPIIRCMTKDT